MNHLRSLGNPDVTPSRPAQGMLLRDQAHQESDALGMGQGSDRLRWIWLMTLAIPTVYAVFFLVTWNRVGPADYDQFLVFHELQYWNSALFAPAKQWCPVLGTGVSLASEPQVPFLSLSMGISYLLGPLAGLQLAIILYFILGWIGAFLYAGTWIRQHAPRCLAASLFIGNGFFICRLTYGHVDFLSFLILPFFLWILHRSCSWPREGAGIVRILRFVLATLLLGAGIALVVDGSPVAIIHLMFWTCLYAAVLAWVERSIAPVIVMAIAVGMASMLDAGYLWPMLAGQAEAPRRTPDRFSNPLAALWFAVVPMRGKAMIPANGKGYEFSVFIGPVIAYCLWRYRGILNHSLPSRLKYPLAIVAAISLFLAMGSLTAVHIPVWLSPFDWLRPLPGFRSLDVTGRFAGFLALPLAMLGAVAVWKFINESLGSRRLAVMVAALFIFQFAYQIEPMVRMWSPSRLHVTPGLTGIYDHGAQEVNYVLRAERLQGELITPIQGVIDCYDMDDIAHGNIQQGAALVQATMLNGIPMSDGPRANFLTWNRIRIAQWQRSPDTGLESGSGSSPVEMVFNQSYDRHWRADGGEVLGSHSGNLVVRCDLARLRRGPMELSFTDPVSSLGAVVSGRSWTAWMAAMGLVAISTMTWRWKQSWTKGQ
jgi:hypothetical protein